MRMNRSVISYLSTELVSRHGPSTIDSNLSPQEDETVNLGSASYKFDTIYCRNLVSDYVTGSGGDADMVDGIHAYSSPNPNALLATDANSKFSLTAIYQGHGSTLDADTLDTLQPSANPGSTESILKCDNTGLLTLKHESIIGGANETQLSVKKYSSQNVPIFKVLDSDDTNRFIVTDAGNIGISASPAQNTLVQANISRTSLGTDMYGWKLYVEWDPIASAANDVWAWYNDLILGGSSSYSVGSMYNFWVYNECNQDHTVPNWWIMQGWSYMLGGNITSYGGINLILDMEYANSISNAYGIKIHEGNETAHITNFYHLYLEQSPGSTGHVDNEYGLKIGNLVGDVSSYAIHTGTALVSFGDDVEFRQAASISTTTGDLTLDPAGNIITDPTGDQILPATGFDIDIGSFQKKYLVLHAAELNVETLVAQETIATVGGRIMVSNTSYLIADVNTVQTTIDVKHNNLWNTERVFLQADMKFECMQIASWPTAITGGYRYTVVRNLDGTGANAWYAGDAVVSTGGSSGPSHLELFSHMSHASPPFDHIFVYDDSDTYGPDRAYDSFFDIFPDPAEANDKIYFGMHNTTFSNVYFRCTGANYDATFTYHYFNGTGWTPLVNATVPNFEGTIDNHVLLFDAADQTGWAKINVNGETAYWVRIVVATVTTWTNSPTQCTRRINRERKAYGPTIIGWARNSTTWNDLSPMWAIGNLEGLYGQSYGKIGVALGKEGGPHAIYGTADIKFYNTAGNATATYGSNYIELGETSYPHIKLTSTDGIELKNSSVRKIWLQADGDVFVGSDLATAANTYLCIFSTGQTYNSETVAAGDMLIGDNSANKANIYWDKSEGQMLFRGGQSTMLLIDTDGTLTAGNGYCSIGSGGFNTYHQSGGSGGKIKNYYNDSGTLRTMAQWFQDYQPGVFNDAWTWIIAYRTATDPWNDAKLVLCVNDSVAGNDTRLYMTGVTGQIDMIAKAVTFDAPTYIKRRTSEPGTAPADWGVIYMDGNTYTPRWKDEYGVGNIMVSTEFMYFPIHNAVLSGAVLSLDSYLHSVAKFRNAVQDIAQWAQTVSPVWVARKVRIRIRWMCTDSSPTGNVRWCFDMTHRRSGQIRQTTPGLSASTYTPCGSQYYWVDTFVEIYTSSVLTLGDTMTLRVWRDGNHAEDTCSSDNIYLADAYMYLVALS